MIDKPNAALGSFATALGILVAIVARGFPGGSQYDVLGPRLFPYIVAGGLCLTGIAILVQAVRGGKVERERFDYAPLLWIIAALIVPVAAIRVAGWIPVCTVLFALGARAFGSRRVWLDLALGLAFGALTFVLFNYALGLNLPAGAWIP